jgi:GT2 family glycosyltransferase
MFTKKTTLIIPTHNRPEYLENTLRGLISLELNFKEVIVVDSSTIENKKIVKKICHKYSTTIFSTRASTSYQRNYGFLKKNKTSKFVMFLDDDIIFLKNSFKEMDKLINKYLLDEYIAGFGFNMISKTKKRFVEKIQKNKFIQLFGLYSGCPGKIMTSGWHTRIANLSKDSFVDWIYTAACVYKIKSIRKVSFDNNFGAYSYLEDLDFCLKLKANYKLIICSKAKFLHPNNIERTGFKFGVIEIFNRFLLVKNNNLNKKKFFIVAFLKFLLSFSIFFQGKLSSLSRAIGNLFGIFKSLLSLFRFV